MVFALTSIDADGLHLIGVFSTHGKALSYLAYLGRPDTSIVPYILDHEYTYQTERQRQAKTPTRP